MTFCVRLADPEEVDILTNLVIRSKFYWGYDDKYRASLKTILAVSPEIASIGDCWVAEAEAGDPVAVCQFNSSASPPHLDLLGLAIISWLWNEKSLVALNTGLASIYLVGLINLYL